MKKVFMVICVFLLLAITAGAAPPQRANNYKETPTFNLSIDNEQYINANNILMFITNHGNFGRDLSGVFGNDYGTIFPYNSVAEVEDGSLAASVVYASGLWIGARDSATNEIRTIISEYEDEYVPGPMSGGTYQTDRPEFKVYKLYSDSLANNPNDDYTNWPEDQGAPVDEFGAPAMIGDQMCWAVFNDADAASHLNGAGSTNPLGIEVRQTTFAFDRTDPLGNVIFFRIQAFNKGSNVLKDCYFALWADPDLGMFTDDLVGCDTVLSMGFIYNGDNEDNQFPDPNSGTGAIPAAGYDFFQGPLVYTGDLNDEAKMWGTTFPGYINMGMSSFNKYINGTDPDNFQETYNYMRGLNRDGSPYTYGGVETKYFVSGDPVKGSGDLDFAPADRRFMMSTGPITFRPGDSTEILAALVVGQGIDRKTSISVMKYYDRFAQDAYENDFRVIEPPVAPKVTVGVNDRRIALSWTDTSEVNHGTYPFEGYAVWMSESSTGPWTQVANLDEANFIEDIFDDIFDVTTGVLEYRLVKNGVNEGIAHDIVIEEDFVNGGSLHNLTTYWFKVDAYTYNPDAPVAVTQTSQTIVSGTPQSPIAGTSYEYSPTDLVSVIHAGGSDGFITPYVVDQKLFTGDTYLVTFADSVGLYIDTTIPDPALPEDTVFVSIDVGWNLVDITTGDTVIAWQWNQLGDSTYEEIDGLLLNVAGPPLELNTYEWEGSTRTLTGVDAGMSSFFGGIGLLGEFFGASSLTAGDMIPIEIRWVEDGTGQSGYMYRRIPGVGYPYYGFQPNQNIEVYDVSVDPPRQINFAFVEFYDPTDDAGQNSDSIWNPGEQLNIDGSHNSVGGREYFFVFNSDYSETENPLYANDDALFESTTDILYNAWLTYRRDDGKPDPGDIFRLIPNYVNTPSDTFTFVLSAPNVQTSGEEHLAAINTVPNPFYLFGPYDPVQGNYQMKFQHLPAECTIRIFNLGGDLIRTIEHNDVDDSWTNWDLKTTNGLIVASGIYVYVVEAPGFGTKIGKMAIFTEVEVLKTY